jgi:hypothetical protein
MPGVVSAGRDVRYWPIATDRILVADRRFRGITDMTGAAAGRTRTRMTQSGRSRFAIAAVQLDPEPHFVGRKSLL